MTVSVRKKIVLLTAAIVLLWGGAATAFSLNENVIFSVDSGYDAFGRQQVSATLRYVGEKSLVYFEDEWWNNLQDKNSAAAAAGLLISEFDKTIYPRLTQVYGLEWSPGVDNEPRIAILITRLKEGAGGYYNSADEYFKSQIPSSNEREMIYLNSLYLNSSRAKVFLAHEFQHMINFNQKERTRGLVEDVWLNEARSEYAATLCGYDSEYSGSNLERRVAEFLRSPSVSLTEWRNELENYGAVNLFMQYFVSRYGQNILTKIMANDQVGIASIDKALSELGSPDRFTDIFVNWAITNHVNSCGFGEGQKFCYLNQSLNSSRLRVSPSMINLLTVSDGASFSFADNIKDWSAHWYDITALGRGAHLILRLSGVAHGDFRVPVVLHDASGPRSVRYFEVVAGQSASTLVLDFGSQIQKVVIIPIAITKKAGFTANETSQAFSYEAKITTIPRLPESSTSQVSGQNISQPAYANGSLIRAQGDFKVYVINGRYKRWLQSSQIFAMYPHFSWQAVKEVTSAERDWYQDAWLIRADGDSRVYEINGDGSKHWLNMSAQAFSQSGRQWDMVYVVNKTERDFYRTGADVLK